MCCPKTWFYVIGWLPDGADGDVFRIPVLMSGRVVPLTRGKAGLRRELP